MATIGSSAQGEGAEFLDGSKTLVTRFQMPEAGTITHTENFLESYSPPGSAVTYYPVIYRGTSSAPTTIAYSAGATSGLAEQVNSHTLSSSITHTAGEYLWAGFGADSGVGSSYSAATGGADAPMTGAMPPPATFTPDYVEADYRWSCALIYTPSVGGGDTTPDSFTFTDVTNAALSTQYTSNTITVSGIDTASPISISGGTYNINGGSYTSASGNVNNGDTVTVRVTSSGSNSTAVNATLTIGGVSDTYSVTTLASLYTIDSLDSPVRVGGTHNITTTGLGTLTTASTIGGKAIASAAATGGDGTITAQGFVDGQTYPAMGTQTVIASDGVDTAGISRTLDTMAGWQWVNVSGLNTGDWSLGKAFSGGDTPAQLHVIDDGTGNLNADGTLTDWPDSGVFTCWARMNAGTYSVGTMKSFTFTVASGGVIIIGSGFSRNWIGLGIGL